MRRLLKDLLILNEESALENMVVKQDKKIFGGNYRC